MLTGIIPTVVKRYAYVISTVRPQSGLKWRNLFKTDSSTSLCSARNDVNERIYLMPSVLKDFSIPILIKNNQDEAASGLLKRGFWEV